MSWLALITGLIKLVGLVADYANNRQLISAGEAKAVSASLQATLENIDAARHATDAMADGHSIEWAKRVRDRFSR